MTASGRPSSAATDSALSIWKRRILWIIVFLQAMHLPLMLRSVPKVVEHRDQAIGTICSNLDENTTFHGKGKV